jgi:hypothetical protein
VTRADWPEVRERIAGLAAEPTASSIFGFEDHRCQLEPPLSATELAEIEAQIRVRLPSEYRSFLLEVSRGGAGPAYGLFTPRRVNGR